MKQKTSLQKFLVRTKQKYKNFFFKNIFSFWCLFTFKSKTIIHYNHIRL